jgi:hypothetical protein
LVCDGICLGSGHHIIKSKALSCAFCSFFRPNRLTLGSLSFSSASHESCSKAAITSEARHVI